MNESNYPTLFFMKVAHIGNDHFKFNTIYVYIYPLWLETLNHNFQHFKDTSGGARESVQRFFPDLPLALCFEKGTQPVEIPL